jgi:hypothetical protein
MNWLGFFFYIFHNLFCSLNRTKLFMMVSRTKSNIYLIFIIICISSGFYFGSRNNFSLCQLEDYGFHTLFLYFFCERWIHSMNNLWKPTYQWKGLLLYDRWRCWPEMIESVCQPMLTIYTLYTYDLWHKPELENKLSRGLAQSDSEQICKR